MRIAVDAMSGDLGVATNVAACIMALSEFSQLEILLVGDKNQLSKALSNHSLTKEYANRIQTINASDVVTMEDSPSSMLRNKQDSSMHNALRLLKNKEVNACVSSGNTGALMVLSKHILGMQSKIRRPAIIAAIPTKKNKAYILDLGANLDTSAENLVEFALLGSVFVSLYEEVKNPKVALLNVGSEEIKGLNSIKMAATTIQESTKLNYYGYLEGDKVFEGDVDVLVCDGFVGNVLLKTAEGVMQFFLQESKRQASKNWRFKITSFLAKPLYKELKNRLNPYQYNGGIFLGLNGLVVKSHGSSDARTLAAAIGKAAQCIEMGVDIYLGNNIEKLIE